MHIANFGKDESWKLKIQTNKYMYIYISYTYIPLKRQDTLKSNTSQISPVGYARYCLKRLDTKKERHFKYRMDSDSSLYTSIVVRCVSKGDPTQLRMHFHYLAIYELWSTLLVSPLISPVMVPCMNPYIISLSGV